MLWPSVTQPMSKCLAKVPFLVFLARHSPRKCRGWVGPSPCGCKVICVHAKVEDFEMGRAKRNVKLLSAEWEGL